MSWCAMPVIMGTPAVVMGGDEGNGCEGSGLERKSYGVGEEEVVLLEQSQRGAVEDEHVHGVEVVVGDVRNLSVVVHEEIVRIPVVRSFGSRKQRNPVAKMLQESMFWLVASRENLRMALTPWLAPPTLSQTRYEFERGIAPTPLNHKLPDPQYITALTNCA